MPIATNQFHKYNDILTDSRPPLPYDHPPMKILNRAKLFAPFAALRGYEEKLAEERRKPHVTPKLHPRKTRYAATLQKLS